MGMLKSQQSFLPRPQPLPLDGRGERRRWEGRAVLFLCFPCFLRDLTFVKKSNSVENIRKLEGKDGKWGDGV